MPVVSLIATGGTRMQEGVPALRQLQQIARHVSLLRESGLPHITVLRNPTTGGVWASPGAAADVVLAVRGAQVAFAGRRTRPHTTADDSAYIAEAQFAAGFVDELVDEGEISGSVAEWMSHLATSPLRSAAVPSAPAYLDDYFTSRRDLRAGRVADGMLCGFGLRDGRAVAYAAQTGTAAARVPVTTLVIGEGGSGGALALCSTDRVWIAPNAYFSVIAPELAAGILKRVPEDVPTLAGELRLRPHELLKLGVIDGIADG